MEKRNEKVTYDALYREAETKTNYDNVKCLLVLAIIIILCSFLNEIGIFKVEPTVMRLGTMFGSSCYLTPVIVMLIYDRFRKKHFKRVTEYNWFKYLLLTFTWLGTVCACVMLTHQAILSMAIPIIIMAQYRNSYELVPTTVLFTTICVMLGVYGGYFFGCFDANMLHIGITDENEFNLALRVQLATPKRMSDLLTHYALPRELIMLALIFLTTKISKRNDRMLKRQAELQSTIELEMERNNEIQLQIIDGLANLIENRDANTGEHVKRTSYYVGKLAKSLKNIENLSDEQIETIRKAAPLHDIGKIVVTDRILQKPGRLTPEEYEEIKKHASEGERIIQNVLGSVEDEKFLQVAEEIAGYHHERYDGKGYPKGLSGKEIPLPARIMAVADVYDALVSKRVYKEPINPEDAFNIIKEESGKQFDPEIVDAFLNMKPEIIKLLTTKNE